MLTTYKEVDDEHLYRRNLLTLKVLGIRNAILKMDSKKLITLNNMLHIANIRKTLVYSSLLRKKNKFKIVFKSDKFIPIKRGMFVKK
jgi:hypothetical protein